MKYHAYCGHTAGRNGGVRVLRVDCRICTPLEYRCVYCFWRPERRVPTECYGGAEHQRGEGYGAVCPVCGMEPFTTAGNRGRPCRAGVTAHHLVVYPFQCDVCSRSVSIERPTLCDSWDGMHTLSSGTVDLGIRRDHTAAPGDGAVQREIDALLVQLRGNRLMRRFVSRARR